MKWLHLRMVCGVSTNAEVPGIWSDVAAAHSKQEGLALLVQYLMSGMQVCRRDFMGHADLLHVSIPLYNFVAGDRFTNPGDNPACPAGGMSLWTSLQGQNDIGYRMATADADMAALDGRNAAADQIARAARIHLQVINEARNLQEEIGTKAYILHSLFGAACPLVRAYSTQIVDHIDANFSSFERQMSSPARCTSFGYDLSVAESRYYNDCIRTSTTAGDIDAPGAIIPVSFEYLRTELTWGRYTGTPLPASLQSLIPPPGGITPRAPALQVVPQEPAPLVPTIPGRPGVPGSRNGGRDGAVVINARPIPRFALLPTENTRGVLRSATLPSMHGSVFCKRFHLGLTCYANCPRAASHCHPTIAIVDEVSAALVSERSAAANS